MVLDTNIVSAFLRHEAPNRTPKLYEFVRTQLAAEGLAIAFVT